VSLEIHRDSRPVAGDSGFSLIPKRLHGIGTGRTSGGKVRGDGGGYEHEGRGHYKRWRIERLNCIQLTPAEAIGPDSGEISRSTTSGIATVGTGSLRTVEGTAACGRSPATSSSTCRLVL
jgi:hypothetical protein